jgi:uroporphyrinogen decarboxylase
MLERKKADRIGVYESFWGDTHREYVNGGFIKPDEDLHDHFDLDIRECWAFNNVADLDFVDHTIEETEDTRLVKNGNGAILRWHKKHASTPENVAYTVTSRAQWEEVREKLVNIDERRIDFESYRRVKAHAKAKDKFFVVSGVNVFEQLHPLCGHENMLVGMALDPDWITDMVNVYSEMTLQLQEILFAKEGKPDGIWYYEDMGFKQRPFISPAMYRELIFPSHKRSIAFAHERNLPVIMHSCGFVEPLLPGMVEAGIDCFQTIEIKAGMDLFRIYKNFGDVLSLMGGVDVRVLYSNDKALIDRELEAKIPVVKEKFGYCLFSDHSIPNTVHYETYKYFIEKGIELGRH